MNFCHDINEGQGTGRDMVGDVDILELTSNQLVGQEFAYNVPILKQ